MADNREDQKQLAREVLAGEREILSSTPRTESMAEIPADVKAQADKAAAQVTEKMGRLPSQDMGTQSPPDAMNAKEMGAMREEKMSNPQYTPQLTPEPTPAPTPQPTPDPGRG